MEVHLKNLCQDTLPLRYKVINEQAQLALDTLDTQKVSFAFKAWQIREKCLAVMKLALESHNPSICFVSLNAIEYLVHHPDLDGVAGEEVLDSMDSRIFVLQVLDSLSCLPNLPADQQVTGLKILLSLCCNFVSSFDGELIIKIVQMCLACWHKDKNNVHSAMIQLCAAFTMHKQKLCAATCYQKTVHSGVNCAAESLASQAVEKLANADLSSNKNSDKLADVIGLAKFFVQQTNLASSENQKGVFLECLYAVLRTLEVEHISNNAMFATYVSNDLCPTLVSVITLNSTSSKIQLLKGNKGRRLRNKLDGTVTRSATLHRKVALLSVELVRLVGSVASLRPHVALVFTHLLSSSTCARHGIPFAVFNKLWATPEMLFNLAGPFQVQDVESKQHNAGLLQIVIDAMLTLCAGKVQVEGSSVVESMQAAITSLNVLLLSIDQARNGGGLRRDQMSCYINYMNSRNTEKRSSTAPSRDRTNSSVQEVTSDSPEKGDVAKHVSDDDDEVWLSSEDIFTAMSSPYYQSAAEDEEELNQLKGDSSSLLGLMQYIARTKKLRDDDDDQSSISTFTESADAQDVVTDEEMAKYIEDAVLSEDSRKLRSPTDNARDCILARRHFLDLKELVRTLLRHNDVTSIDQALQKAASQFCSDIYEKWKMDKISVQAECLYTLSYSILLLSLRMKVSGLYQSSGAQLPCVKSQWVTYQQSCGVYLSKSWLSETFRQIVLTDILEPARCGVDDADTLVAILGEIDGFGLDVTSSGSSDVAISMDSPDANRRVGMEFSRQVFISIWSDMLQVLQSPLLKIFNSKESDFSFSLFQILSPLSDCSQNIKSCIVASLNALQTTIKISCALDLQGYASTVITHLVEACIPKQSPFLDSSGELTGDNLRLHATQVLLMNTVLETALTIGKKSSKSWDAVFRVVTYLAHLDHVCFHSDSPDTRSKEKFFDIAAMREKSVTDLIKEDEVDQPSVGFFTNELSVKIVYSLSRCVDALFEQAVLKLDLRTLTDFIWTLCSSSNRQLFTFKSDQDLYVPGTPLLYRLGECILACARSSKRPLLHITNLWRYAAPHFTKVLGHGNTHFAKQAGTYIYNMVTTVLSYPSESLHSLPIALWSEQEPKYFHFVENLLRPYERALQSEMCAVEVQELVIGAISQLVETSSNRICSGWRPLFSALKHITCSQQAMDRSPIYEVLNAFIVAASSPPVFASAAHDCINCLLKLLGNLQDDSTDISLQATPIISYLEEVANTLLHLHQSGCQGVLGGFHAMEGHSYISHDSGVWRSLTEPMWLQSRDNHIDRVAKDLDEKTRKCFSSNSLSDDRDAFELNDIARFLHTWFYLLDGLTLRTLTSSRALQPAVLDLLCKLLHKSPRHNGFSFSCYVLLHSCLPTLRSFLHRLVNTQDIDLISYKHTFGTLMELTASVILKNVQHTSTESVSDDDCYHFNNKLWNAYLNLCVICIETRREQLAKLACSCIKHVITMVGKWLSSSMIDDLCSCLSYIIGSCLTALTSLTSLVEENSRVLDEMVVDEKRSDSVFCDASCLTRIFQLATYPQSQKPTHHIEVRLTHKSPTSTLRVSLCELACDVSTLSLILKCVEYMLLGSSSSPWKHANNVASNLKENSSGAGLTSSLHSTSSDATKVPDEGTCNGYPLLEYLSSEQLHDLSEKMVECFLTARKFDSLPELQRFVQKLIGFYNAANLYQFTGLSICVYLRTLLAICCQLHPYNPQSEHKFRSRSFTSGIVPFSSDLLPPLEEVEDGNEELIKSTASSWAYHALNKSIIFLCQPWDTDEVIPLPNLLLQDRRGVEKEDDVSSTQESTCSDHMSDDSRSQRSLDINLDYMAYVKRTESLSPSKVHLDDEITRSKRSMNRKLYKVAADKVFASLISAYKGGKQRTKSHTSIYQQGEESAQVDGPFHRKRTLSERSTHSGVIALDEQLLKRQAWSSTVESLLRLLTSAPDSALAGLLPVIYEPLSSLANHRPMSNPLVVGECGNDVGDAFHKWLLRIGQFCDFVGP